MADRPARAGHPTPARVHAAADRALEAAIIAELSWTPSISADGVAVSVNDGAVSLTGQVRTHPEKAEALQAAMRVRGVARVANDIVVQEHRRGIFEEGDIAEEASRAFERTLLIPAGSVTATVNRHVVTLSGTVDWPYQRDAARAAVVGLPGVGGVRNTVTLRSAAAVSPADVAARITSSLLRHARVDAGHIHVGVTGSDITLTGTVSSWAEHGQAEAAAWSPAGVTRVDNRLTVETAP